MEATRLGLDGRHELCQLPAGQPLCHPCQLLEDVVVGGGGLEALELYPMRPTATQRRRQPPPS